HRMDAAPPEQAAARKDLADRAHVEERRAHGTPPSPAAKHATRWVPVAVIGGASRRQMSIASGQRGWNRQPPGGSARLGGFPSRLSRVMAPPIRGRLAIRWRV